MDSYQTTVQDNLMQVEFNADCPAENYQLVKEVAAKLDRLATAGNLSGGSLLKINGPQSVPICYVIAHKVAHLDGAISVYDPKLKQYIVCITHNPAYRLGDLIL